MSSRTAPRHRRIAVPRHSMAGIWGRLLLLLGAAWGFVGTAHAQYQSPGGEIDLGNRAESWPAPGWSGAPGVAPEADLPPLPELDGYGGHSIGNPALLPAPAGPEFAPSPSVAGAWDARRTLPPSQLWGSAPPPCSAERFAQCLPEGLLYRSYLAGEKEPRISSAWLNERDRGLVWDVTLGGRVALWRYGTAGPVNPQGFELDMEGGAMVRLDPEANTDVEAVDFRFGFLATWREGPWAAKSGYYHVSSHLGDEFLLRNPGFPRLNYVRDSAIAGLSYDVSDSIRVYSEAAYAIGHEGGALPLEFQYGAEYSSPSIATSGGPYAGINGHTREDRNWITGVNIVGGWQWRGHPSGHRFRAGVQYYQGPALQYSFVGRNERLLGAGMWFDY